MTLLSRLIYSLPLLISFSIMPLHAQESHWEWDFDHKMSFMVTHVEDKIFLISVDTNKLSMQNMEINAKGSKTKGKGKKNDKSFERGAALLIRKSLSLCKGYHYQLEIMDGVSGVNDYKERSNYIFGDLKAKLTCS